MEPDDLRDYLNAAPFVPLRLHMGNGRTADIRHPEMALVADYVVAIAESNGDKTNMRMLALMNINEVEQLAPVN